MTNEQIQALQAAADATQATEWEFHERYSLSHAGGGYVSINGVEAIWCLNKAVGGMAHSKDVLRYIAAANPAVILSLLAERDADKALIAVYSDAYKEAAHEVSVNWEAATALAEENTELKRRIAELEERERRIIKLANDSGELCDRVMDALESRTLTVKFPEPLMPAQHNSGELFMTPDNVEQGGYLNCDDVLRALRKACVAAGIKLDVGGG